MVAVGTNFMVNDSSVTSANQQCRVITTLDSNCAFLKSGPDVIFAPRPSTSFAQYSKAITDWRPRLANTDEGHFLLSPAL